ncbi:J domain-containing protein CG6693 [Sabethes cyaneus]|uniref:J domain-containing protein CG6693 n=1 Tax=Sabethes cyaneus TaxID=53552 RepID=UPI00237D9B07|nr:J domain-containing protein CG6693 [Sabethes cyaneus]XP_053687872.1 J domain-containing protein CG6693 [Sabethes cyaneus]
MPSTLELCENFYGTKNIYELFAITKNASENDIKKAYYRLSLIVHPDRVKEEDKIEATEKFKVLSKIHSVLSDKDKRALYDEKGIIDEDDEDSLGTNWLAMWQQFFKPITTEDISKFEKEFIGSELERGDIKKAYLNGKGSMDYMHNCVPFMSCEDEPRIISIVKEMIASGEVPEFKTFTEEPEYKKERRRKKEAREARKAESIKKQMEDNNLEQQILQRQAERAQDFDSLIEKLALKYGDDNTDDAFDIDEYTARKKPGAKNSPLKRLSNKRITKRNKPTS